MLISFEGIDGCGKTTQIMLLRERLEKELFPAEVLREPGGTTISEMIRGLLLNPDVEMNSVTELLLFSAARSELISSKVKPLLKRNVIVILDRYYDSTVAYQGFGRGCLPIAQIHSINAIASHGLIPNLTFYLDIDLKEAVNRRKNQANDRMEASGAAFYQRVIDGFRFLASKEKRFKLIDATQTPEEIHKIIWNILKKELGKKRTV